MEASYKKEYNYRMGFILKLLQMPSEGEALEIEKALKKCNDKIKGIKVYREIEAQ